MYSGREELLAVLTKEDLRDRGKALSRLCTVADGILLRVCVRRGKKAVKYSDAEYFRRKRRALCVCLNPRVMSMYVDIEVEKYCLFSWCFLVFSLNLQAFGIFILIEIIYPCLIHSRKK